MEMPTIKYGKKVTVSKTVNGAGSIKTWSTKAKFFQNLPSMDCFEMIVSSNINSVVSKIESLGFNVVVDDSWGFEWECKLIATK